MCSWTSTNPASSIHSFRDLGELAEVPNRVDASKNVLPHVAIALSSFREPSSLRKRGYFSCHSTHPPGFTQLFESH